MKFTIAFSSFWFVFFSSDLDSYEWIYQIQSKTGTELPFCKNWHVLVVTEVLASYSENSVRMIARNQCSGLFWTVSNASRQHQTHNPVSSIKSSHHCLRRVALTLHPLCIRLQKYSTSANYDTSSTEKGCDVCLTFMNAFLLSQFDPVSSGKKTTNQASVTSVA